ncbi:hypothetical protein RI543_002622 [Arxiozyma heterogenica]|uniref:Uncharacterized protein n=1 Tax=Arxiozyma heterogenica TaxID=278026 RepID=A0AAN7WHP6_9SACH|nr:hypothetical protein RI543_002622 [Kazachstania heterogenica]
MPKLLYRLINNKTENFGFNNLRDTQLIVNAFYTTVLVGKCVKIINTLRNK